jgi:hypothetical protein
MKIGQKLLVGAIALTLVPLALTAGLLWQGTTSLSGQTVDAQVQTQLSALRDQKSQQLKDEFEYRMAALRTLGGNQATVEAMARFKTAFADAAKEAGKLDDAAANRRAMLEYVDTQFGPEFKSSITGRCYFSAISAPCARATSATREAFASSGANTISQLAPSLASSW